MMRLSLLLLALVFTSPLATAADKLKQLIVKPGETVYARFEVQPKKLTLVSAGTEPDAGAQVIFTLTRDEAKPMLKLRIENKLPRDLQYRAEIRSKTLRLRTSMKPVPVVAGKLGYELMPGAVEEFVAFDFAYARYTPAPETPKGG
ncbi:MAG: hypothetical protein ACOZE5_01720 [Verrucomicrobiota bacterium]